ncbi:MAG: phosphotransferase family protein [Acidimicrobiia bacterium]|nr:phosphotransferase family protein [Acidimicrobiia bacterium]
MTDALPGLDHGAVTAWLGDHVEVLERPVRFSLIAAGGSNLTFRVADESGHAVALRRPPVTAVLATAHDMDREWRILTGLTGTAVPVPAPVARCDDVAVTGAPFYVMGFVDGTILRTEADGARFDGTSAATATDSLVDVQVALHALDPDAVGLGDLTKRHTGYVERQLRRWRTQVDRAKVRELPVLDDLHDRLARTVPAESRAPSLVHGDYRFDNVVLGPDHHVAAVLDWELCTIGDAVADACWSLLYWIDPGDALPFLDSAPTLAPVFPRRADAAARYATRSGRDLDSLGWFSVFGYWKMACIVEGVYARRLEGARGGGAQGDPSSIASRVDAYLAYAADAAVGIL